jgi:hypothetical protein
MVRLLAFSAVVLIAIGLKVLCRWHQHGGNDELAAGAFSLFLGAVLAIVAVLAAVR